MRDDTSWFLDMFAVLIELACPNCSGAEDLEPFLRDLEEGMATSRSDYQS